MIKAAHHVAMVTRDLDRILKFYRDGLGLKAVGEPVESSGPEMDAVVGLEGASCRVAMLALDNLFIEFFEYLAPAYDDESVRQSNRPGWTHIAFVVPDLNEAYELALAAGATFHTEPKSFGDVRATYGRDPDGNIFEMMEIAPQDHPWQLKVRAVETV